MRQRDHEPDRAMTTHSEVAHIVEENHSGGGLLLDGVTEQRSDNNV
jgi:hypothetical protein